MVINGKGLIEAAPILNMLESKHREHGVSYGLAEVGYDIRLKQDISFYPDPLGLGRVAINEPGDGLRFVDGNFTIASVMEEFQMPDHLMGIVHDKSTWARKGLGVFNTVIEPGWRGFLTLELVYNGREPLHISAGAGIAQVIFHQVAEPAVYHGKYQDQADRPVASVFA
jgi:dCTP deaminase